MRTTVRLNEYVLRTAKKAAVERQTTLTALIEAGLRYVISLSSEKSHPRKIIRLKTVRGSGLKVGVNLDHNADLLAKMDQ